MQHLGKLRIGRQWQAGQPPRQLASCYTANMQQAIALGGQHQKNAGRPSHLERILNSHGNT